MLVISWHLMPKDTPKEVPVFNSAETQVKLQVGLENVISQQKVRFREHQGKSAFFSFALVGAGSGFA